MGTTVECRRDGRSATLTVNAGLVASGAHLGDSVAVNGCCLTVINFGEGALTFDAIPETLDRTNLGDLCAGDRVNLERPLAASARLDGHFVQGHIDGVGTILSLTPDENAVIIEIEAPKSLSRYLVEKGSIAVDGVSLTIAGVSGSKFTIWTIPHTRRVTTLGARAVGDRVNLECDILGKYVERLLEERSQLVGSA